MRKKGYALIVTIYVIVVFAALGITVAAFIASESVSNILVLNGLKALHIAEGGAEYVLANDLLSDLNWLDNNGQSHSNTALGEGVFDSIIYSNDPSSCTIEATGYMNRGNFLSGIQRRVRIELERQVEAALINAMYSVDRINLNHATGTVTGGGLMSGQDVVSELSGSYSISSYESVSLPSVDWTQYKGIAQSQGHYYAGDLDLSGVTLSGVNYVDGNVRIRDNVTINGSLICRGKINMNQADNLFISSEAYYPALVADIMVTGEITGTHLQDSYINGLIYSSGNITFNVIDNVTIVGAIVCGGRISIVNGSGFNLTYDPRVTQTAYMGSNGDIVITKWQNF
ncbi:hypothetical protein A2276_03185 [candidate division WOR-1 bacterium RIFOXYA12_FULL_43_27]|uniref:Type 4 fimbrial biogenesis protein PilX N-terminal domain-containing protein n=1 Tax=candidate division WOR-1 bacterium RIFOXYC2_FULL_46_14 TaxID=1802587 RepID=A0A1F4U7E4_UNCSA|nr:MAG: hypothetical protein A2276_03185 [candidate division WOR-1 bacterium RIFOXYA12_FULL_43_27]OGC19294.1 MAG: hypothetical protein A2292_01150 [candidate division WOR-1 bacterium RIFOXYB2_FULL_46_45]OGC30283.1 MAG: hypothetical protein A2232_01150 [candidate division WOR-1 bacterium RIFOXYA2_FULL_46_56]OGC40884.1 MAG: hypothetical protein A2438_01150 [candidate division WOR-1 bacterium RIFOXYC2_FULL_46_14]